MKDYLEINFHLEPVEARDILLALLDNLGYDSFEETDLGLKAYVLEQDFEREELENLFLFNNPDYKITYEVDRLENKNWNEEWETHYSPIVVDDQLYVRASFHPSRPDLPQQILITPKMSFGTGHHQTTRLMCRLLLKLSLDQKEVLDMGTGTGILAILAEMRGARKVVAIDNFEWAVENAAENAENNNCSKIQTLLGDAQNLESINFDVVVANINRNVLLQDMKYYIDTLNPGGQLLLSGFLEHDFHHIDIKATECGAKLVDKVQEDRWLACQYEFI